MDVLDLFLLLFSGTATSQRGDGGVHRREFVGTFGGKPNVPPWRLSIFVVHCRGSEYRRIERRKMASERRRGDDVHSAAVARCGRRGGVAEFWVCDALHLGEHDASMELGNREFLAANSFCVCRTRTSFGDERRNS